MFLQSAAQAYPPQPFLFSRVRHGLDQPKHRLRPVHHQAVPLFGLVTHMHEFRAKTIFEKIVVGQLLLVAMAGGHRVVLQMRQFIVVGQQFMAKLNCTFERQTIGVLFLFRKTKQPHQLFRHHLFHLVLLRTDVVDAVVPTRGHGGVFGHRPHQRTVLESG